MLSKGYIHIGIESFLKQKMTTLQIYQRKFVVLKRGPKADLTSYNGIIVIITKMLF